MIHKRMIKNIVASTVAIMLAACLSVTALGVTSVGEIGSGGGSTGNSNLFAIADDSDEGGIVGYRFSIVNENGRMLEDTNSVDILCSSSKDYDIAQVAYSFANRRPKTWWVQNYSDNILDTEYFQKNNSKYVKNIYTDRAIGLALSTLAADIKVQVKDKDIFNIIMDKLGTSYKDNTIPDNVRVLFEPLFLVHVMVPGIAAWDWTTMTISDIGGFGGAFFDDHLDGGVGTSGSKASWGYIANLTNGWFPSRLYVPGAFVWEAGAYKMDGYTVTVGDKTVKRPNTRLSFGTLIYQGYGVGYAYGDPDEQTVDFDASTEVRLYRDAAHTDRVWEGETLEWGKTYYPVFHFYSDAREALDFYVNYGCLENNDLPSYHGPFAGEFLPAGAPITISDAIGIDKRNPCLTLFSRIELYGDQYQSETGAKYTEPNTANNDYSYSWPVDITTPVTVRPGKADGSTAIELFYDEDRTQRVPDGELLREGVTYYPRLWFYSNTSEVLTYTLKYQNATYDSGVSEWVRDFAGEVFWDVHPFTIGARWAGETYDYNTSLIVMYSSIELWQNDKNYVDADLSDNNAKRENKFTIIQPSAQPILYDLTGVETLVNSVNNQKLYSGQALNGNVLFTNNSSFSARFRYGTGYTEQYLREISAQNQEYWYSYDNTYQHWYNGTEENYVAPGGIWTTAGINFRAYADSLADGGFIATGCVEECSYWEATGNKTYETVGRRYYTVYPTDLAASNIQFIDADTGEVLNKVCSGQRIFVRYVFANNTGVPVLAAYHGGHDNTVAVFAAYTFGSNEVKKDTLVIPANGRIYIETSPFLADGKNHSVIKAESNIYLFDKVGNTYFETNRTNNVKKNDAVGQPGVVPITSPYKVTLVAPNSTYRRGTTVVTSFEIQNLSDVLINGPKQKRAKSNAITFTKPPRTPMPISRDVPTTPGMSTARIASASFPVAV